MEISSNSFYVYFNAIINAVFCLVYMVVRHDELHRQQIEDTVAALADAQRNSKGGNDEGQ